MPERDVHALRAEALAGSQRRRGPPTARRTSRARSGTLRRRRRRSWGIKRRISVQAGSGLVSASSLARASFSSHRTVSTISWSPSTGFRLSNTACAFPSTLVIRGGWCSTSVPWSSRTRTRSPDFRQILKTARMGSALFGPMVWRGQMLGQVLTAAQARHTYGPIDLDIFMGFAHVAAAVYIAHGGPEWLRTLV